MIVVEVQVGLKPGFALSRAVVLEPIRPLTQERLDHALDLTVRAGPTIRTTGNMGNTLDREHG